MLNVFLIASVILLIISIYLTILTIKQRQNLLRFKGIIDIEIEQKKIQSRFETETEELQRTTEELQRTVKKLQNNKMDIENSLVSLKKQLTPLKEEVNIQSYGLYQPKYDLGFSTELKEELDRIRKKQKTMIREKTAIVCSTNWTVDNSRAEGKKMTNRQIQLMARAFNGECDSIIPKIRYNNYDSIVNRMTSTYDAINKLGEPHACKIQKSYFNLKIDELVVVHQYQEQLQFEKEEKRRINEQIRDEQRAQREMEKAREQAEKEEARYQNALEKARQEVEQATGKKQEKLQAEIERLNELLLEVEANKERAISRAQMTRSGYVYIISNIGSFGENVYKIGMTRRLEPTDRVRELGDASVPFPFDIHAMIYSKDAPTLENELHRLLETRSVNRINTRKEFFNVTIEEIETIVKNHNADVNFIRIPRAEQFRQTQAIVAREEHKDTDT